MILPLIADYTWKDNIDSEINIKLSLDVVKLKF